MNTKKIDEKIVEKIAKLSRLKLSHPEIKSYSEELKAILKYIDNLNRVNTDSVEPTYHAISTVKNVFRNDIVKKSLDREEALKNGPKTTGEYFVVPKVIET